MSKFKIASETLNQLCNRVITLVPNKTTREIVKSFKFVLKQLPEGGNLLSLYATDLEVYVRSDEADLVVIREGSFAVPARILHEYVKTLKGEITVDLNSEANVLRLIEGDTQFEVAIQDVEEFPSFPEPKELKDDAWLTLSPDIYRELLSKVEFAVAEENSPKYSFTSICFALESGKLSLMGTDSKRASIAYAPLTHTVTPRQALVEPKALSLICSCLASGSEDLLLQITGTSMIAKNSTTYLVTRLMSGAYPDVNRIVPNHPHKISFDVSELLSYTRKAALAADKQNNMKMTILDKNVMLSSKTREQRKSACIKFATSYEGEGLEYNFDSSHLIDLLKAANSDNIEMFFVSKTKPILFKQDGFNHILVPKDQ